MPAVRKEIRAISILYSRRSIQFIAYTIIGTIPWTIFLVYTGEILGENWMLLLEYKIEIALIFHVFLISAKSKKQRR